VLGARIGNACNNTSVGVEQVVTGHPWLSWDTGGDNDDVAAVKGVADFVVSNVARYGRIGGTVRDISGNAWSVYYVKQGQMVYVVRLFQQQGKWLANTPGGPNDGYFGSSGRGLRKGTTSNNVGKFLGNTGSGLHGFF
jgi:hypothetical protein